MNTPASGEFPIVALSDLPDGFWDPDALTSARNALGKAPQPMLYLWVFERPDSLCAQLIVHGWTKIGPVYLLLSPEARVEGPMIRSSNEIHEAMSRFSSDVGDYKCPVPLDYEVSAAYFGYPINYLWCADNVWTEAFEAVATRCKRFVIDLTAEEEPSGLSMELSYVFEKVPARNIVLLFDQYRGQLDVTRQLLATAWTGIGDRSINRKSKTRPPPLICYDTASAKYLAMATLSQWTGKSMIPLAQRAAHSAGWG